MGSKELPKSCVPCRGGEPMPMDEARALAQRVPEWTLLEGKLRRDFVARDFVSAMSFVNRVGDMAEEEQHHPDLHITRWNHVAIEIWTHAVGGLHVNDFVLAAKVDGVWQSMTAGG